MTDFTKEIRSLATDLLCTTPFKVGQWQSKDVSNIRQFDTYEITDVMLRFPIPREQDELVNMMEPYPNFSWADKHFAERIGGVPVNPPPSHQDWPWNRHNASHQGGPARVFSHTYPERIWPRLANLDGIQSDIGHFGHRGIRFGYGDLQDVIDLMVESPLTRQAYLPIWFPEDTGVAHKQRVPCTLGYHFMIRNGRMSCRYYMRSCDLIRHFSDDIYMAARLLQWVVSQVNKHIGHEGMPESYEVGDLVVYIASLHAFAGDKYTLERIRDESPK